jgi:predicted metalloprotease
MRYEGRSGSGNVVDRRRLGGPVVGGGLGVLVLVLVSALFGVNPMSLLGGGGSSAPPTAEEERLFKFASVVLKDTEDVWHERFRAMGRTYEEPKMVLFSSHVSSACGSASSAVGPFYCPADRTIYLDLTFFRELEQRFGAPGDFAQAYVIAHEVGHHVQNLLGISGRVHDQQQASDEATANRLSVRIELQADFFAGVWAHHAQKTKQILEEGDIEEALNAASAIGDDRLQRQARGTVVPDSFTHGSSAQRVAWFRHGWTTGDVSQGDTLDEATFRRVNPQ